MLEASGKRQAARGKSREADSAKEEKPMTPEIVMNLVQEALGVTLLVSAPLLLAALATGLVVSVFQAATQINEMTLSFIPKLVAVFAAVVLAGPWMVSVLVDFTRRLLVGIPELIG
jgi:flagellar biosynthetic protein FliQ